MSNKIEGLMDSAINKMREIVNADTVIGKSVTTQDGTVVIPVSKVSYGFASGGTDFSVKNSENKDMFGGGNGAGVTIVPVAFLVIQDGDVKLLQIESFSSSLDRIISMTPEVIDKITAAIKKRKNKNDNEKPNS